MKDLGMVILSQTLSLTSNPDLGSDMTLAIRYIGVVNVSFALPESLTRGRRKRGRRKRRG